MEIKSTPVSTVQSVPPVRPQTGAVASPQSDPPAAGDSYHFSLGRKTNGQPAAALRFLADKPNAHTQLGAAVHVDKPAVERPKLLGMVQLTDSQERQVRAAESRAFDRFLQAGNDPARGSLQAKLSQAARHTYQPGSLEHHNGTALHVTPEESKEIKNALQDYGEDVASIAVTGRSRRDLQRYAEDKFFITLFDRDKDELEEYVKGGFRAFTDKTFSQTSPDQEPVSGSSSASAKTPVALPTSEPAEAYRVRYFRPRVGVSMKGLDVKEAMIKPKIDVVRLNGPAETEVRVVADVPFNFNGKIEPKAEVYARRILNHKPGEYGGLSDNVFAESRTEYDVNERRLQGSVGVRKQISPDSSMGFYGMYSRSFSSSESKDLGVGVNYQARFD